MDPREDYAEWLAICAGRVCQLCEAEIRSAWSTGKRYCGLCLRMALQPVQVSIDQRDGGWILSFTLELEPQLTYWMVRVGLQQLERMLQAARIAASERQDIPQALRVWGRTTVHFHLDPAETAHLKSAIRVDPRTGYQKLR